MLKAKRTYKLNMTDVKVISTRLKEGELPHELAKEYNVTVHNLLKTVGDFAKRFQRKEKKLLKFEDITIEMINAANSWKKLRQLGLIVFAKYIKYKANGRCEICNKEGSDAHHWFYTKAHNKLTDIMPANGIFLCRNCHMAAHTEVQRVKDYISTMYKYRDKLVLLTEAEMRPINLDNAKVLIKAMLSEIK